MRILLVIFLLSGLPLLVQGRKVTPWQYKTLEVVAAGDSLVNNLLGNLSEYAKLDSGSYYTYTTKGIKLYSILYRTKRFKIFNPDKTKKNFCDAVLIYHFLMPYPACKWLDTINGTITVGLDTALQLVNRPDLSFIPDMVLHHEPCNVIEMDSAMAIAMRDTIKLGVTHPYAFLKYRPERKQFEWIVLSTLWNDRDFNNNKSTKNDMVVIDAVTGKILIHKVTPFAPAIR